MSKIQAVIFDLDGVIVDTEPISRKAWNIALNEFSAELPDEVCYNIIGHCSAESAEIIKMALGLSLPASALLHRKTTALRKLLAEDIPVIPGLVQLVAKLSNIGLPWAVATSSPRDYAERILKQIDLWNKCTVLTAGDEVSYNKPEADIYALTARRLKRAPRQCLALEDSLPGCRAAASAGMVTVAVPGKYPKRSDFDFVDQLCMSLDEVTANLQRLIVHG
jgi:HAD superfamily hydrolase (TIGR01509 family)